MWGASYPLQFSMSRRAVFKPSQEASRSTAEWHATLSEWFLEQALPRWWGAGTDHTHGGFFEKISLAGQVIDEPRRTRVTARQIYVFSVAHDMDWSGPALDAIDHGLSFLLNCQRQADGTFASSVSVDGAVIDARFDLYEQAFALFALARAYKAQPALTHLPEVAHALYDALLLRWKHPVLGFEESNPSSLPLKSNPHMHLLEALRAWSCLGSDAERQLWATRCDEVVSLCLRHFMDAEVGCILEYFDAQWLPMPDERGRLWEPGHQFEWAWLLMCCSHGDVRGAGLLAAERLMALGEGHGVNAKGLAINELWRDLSIKDGAAKLWPQTERIKAWVTHAARTVGSHERAQALTKVAQACEGLDVYLQGAPAGLWQEVVDANGHFVEQPCRASSLYHIVGAIECLHAHRALMA
jgi:mannose/cellobiose epimerase-like protein (N-acyl-D-glucosamine 2-epimerase family)